MNYLAVGESHRGRGIARALVGHVEALAFYRRLGFVADEVVSFGKRLVVDGASP